MSEKKGFGSKFLGVFVEQGEGEPAEALDSAPGPDREQTPAELVAELARGAGVPSKSPAPRAAPPPDLKVERMTAAHEGPANFDSIFKDAGMDAAELERVHKAEELLKSLPESTPQGVKKQIVEASLRAFGFEVDKIVLAAQNQRKALDVYVRVNEAATAKSITDSEQQIRTLNEKIASLRADIEKRTAGLAGLSASAQNRKAEVQKVVDFFQGPSAPVTP